jgi:hypothetical protein
METAVRMIARSSSQRPERSRSTLHTKIPARNTLRWSRQRSVPNDTQTAALPASGVLFHCQLPCLPAPFTASRFVSAPGADPLAERRNLPRARATTAGTPERTIQNNSRMILLTHAASGDEADDQHGSGRLNSRRRRSNELGSHAASRGCTASDARTRMIRADFSQILQYF